MCHINKYCLLFDIFLFCTLVKAILIHINNLIPINSFLYHNIWDKRGLQPILKCNNIILI